MTGLSVYALIGNDSVHHLWRETSQIYATTMAEINQLACNTSVTGQHLLSTMARGDILLYLQYLCYYITESVKYQL